LSAVAGSALGFSLATHRCPAAPFRGGGSIHAAECGLSMLSVSTCATLVCRTSTGHAKFAPRTPAAHATLAANGSPPTYRRA
jgi:hypothetical protein